MPKPKIKRTTEQEIESKKRIPELLETNTEDREEAVLLLERLNALQLQVGRKPDDKKNKPGSGLLEQVDQIKKKLSSILALSGLDGLRHNSLVFTDCWVDGKKGVDQKAFEIELALAGVSMEVIKACREAATKTGDGYLRRMLIDLDRAGYGYDPE